MLDADNASGTLAVDGCSFQRNGTDQAPAVVMLGDRVRVDVISTDFAAGADDNGPYDVAARDERVRIDGTTSFSCEADLPCDW